MRGAPSKFYVMERGRIVDEGESLRLRTDPNIQSHYLGVASPFTPTAGGPEP
jgi:ABC-type branched-subunit amino acid transport system ATPase component